jgi:hypothetical protein
MQGGGIVNKRRWFHPEDVLQAVCLAACVGSLQFGLARIIEGVMR